MEKIRLSRREFIKAGVAAGGGLLIGFKLSACEAEDRPARPAQPAASATTGDAPVETFTPNAWIRIDSDDSVTIQVGSSEMGQGVLTAIPMIIAEELDADWSKVRSEHAPADKAFTNPLLGRQGTGGSTAVRGFWNIVRQAGAAGREMLIQAAAQRWQVDAGSCHAAEGRVIHDASGRALRYGELVEAAARLPVPDEAFLKEPDEFRIIGTATPRLDTPPKLNGAAVFGMDVALPGLLTAVVARCPVLGGKVKSFDAKAALALPGVKKVQSIPAGIAVIADSFWAAKKGRDALVIEWDEGPNRTLDSAQIFADFKAAVNKGVEERNDGDVAAALTKAAKTLEAEYSVPYQAHACMEPMNATADVRADGCDLYVPTQSQASTQETGVAITGLPRDKVKVHTTFLGGGFGRRSEQDFVADALHCSRAAKAPVKVIWSREDDMMHDQYRPATYNRLRGGVDDKGRVVAWEHRIAGPSIIARVRGRSPADGRDWSSTEGARNIPYSIANAHVSYAMVNPPVPVGFWRSVGSSQNAYITECFVDELAALAGRDPLQVRLELMGDHPRHAGVLQLAADKAGWGGALPDGRARGIAVAEAFGSYVAQVAEVSADRGRVRVHRITCAIDCGITVNPDTIRAQMESGIVYGLTAALKSEITLRNGRVVQDNFDSFPLLRIDECPDIDVHILKSTAAPGGVGEPGVPPTAPAVANAVRALTGRPVRSLPIRLG